MSLLGSFRRWAAYQNTVRELGALDARSLNDLGLTRSDIQRVARDHASRI